MMGLELYSAVQPSVISDVGIPSLFIEKASLPTQRSGRCSSVVELGTCNLRPRFNSWLRADFCVFLITTMVPESSTGAGASEGSGRCPPIFAWESGAGRSEFLRRCQGFGREGEWLARKDLVVVNRVRDWGGAMCFPEPPPLALLAPPLALLPGLLYPD